MVLQDLSEADYDSAAGPPVGDSYSYSQSSNPPNVFNYPTTIDLTQLPQVPLVYRAFFGPATETRIMHINANMRMARAILKRSPTQDETNALAFHAAKGVALQAYGLPLGFGITILRMWQTRHTFAIPFYKPKDLEFVNTWPSSSMPLAKGQLARLAWHSMRFGAHFTAWVIPAVLLAGSYGGTVEKVGLLRDSRMKDFIATMKETAKQSRATTAEVLGKAMRDAEIEKLNELKRLANGPAVGSGAGVASQDDMYGTLPQDFNSGYDPGLTVSDESNASGNTGILSDRQMKAQEQTQRPPNRTIAEPEVQKARSRPQEPTQSSYQMDDPLPFDDASPTASHDPQTVEGTGRSAWDRIRANAGTPANTRGVPPSGARRQQPARAVRQQPAASGAENSGDSFSFSKSDEERSLAKERAQRDFDNMVEKERMGEGSDAATGNAGGSWGR